jgi:hypothetical protein
MDVWRKRNAATGSFVIVPGIAKGCEGETPILLFAEFDSASFSKTCLLNPRLR